jgi:hypothetical protein
MPEIRRNLFCLNTDFHDFKFNVTDNFGVEPYSRRRQTQLDERYTQFNELSTWLELCRLEISPYNKINLKEIRLEGVD